MNTDTHELDMGGNGQNAGTLHPELMGYGDIRGDNLWLAIWRGRWLVLLSIVAAMGATGAYLYVATPTYESTSRILVEKPGPQPRAEVPQPAGSTLSNYLQTQASMITSREIIAAAMRDPNMLTLPTLRNMDYSEEEVIRTLSASVGKDVDIISVTAEAAYAEDAAQIVNAVVRAYIRWHEANRQLSTADLLKNLNSQLERHYQELRTKRKERMMFEQRNPEVVESMRGIISKTLELLKQNLSSARVDTVQAESYYQGLKRFEAEPELLREYVFGRRTSASLPADEGERDLLEEELLRVRLQLDMASNGGAVQFLQVTQLQNTEGRIEKRIADLNVGFVNKQVAVAKTLSEEATALEKQLADMYEKEFAKVQTLSAQESEYAFIVSECQMIQSLCDSLLTQISALDLNARFEGLNIHILEKALPATKPSSPQVLKVVGIGFMLGLVVGVGLALVRDWRDQRLRSADEITRMLGVRVLGAMPSMSRRRISAQGQRLQFAPDSQGAEVCRGIRTALFCGAPREQAMTILVTSPGRLEGKTTLVSNLGIVMAQAGQKTLILDADLRRPTQHRVFSIDGHDRGLTDVLAGTATLDEAIQATEIRGLDVLAAGQSIPNPSELLHSQAFSRILERLKGKYDRILVDSPPVGIVTDAQILATLCGLTLLVLRAEKSTRILTQRARDALITVGARLVGVVVNDVSRRSTIYSHYGSRHCRYDNHDSNGGRLAGEKSLADVGPRPEGIGAENRG